MKSKILHEYVKDRTYAFLKCYEQVAMLEGLAKQPDIFDGFPLPPPLVTAE
jgi:hypothetical protein